MSAAFDSLPREVQQALAAGQRYEAAQLLRKAKGMSMKSALARIEAVVKQGVPMAPAPLQPPARAPAGADPLPDIAALASQLLAQARQRLGGGANPMPADDQLLVGSQPGLAPGEQPPEHLASKATALIVALAAALALLLDWA